MGLSKKVKDVEVELNGEKESIKIVDASGESVEDFSDEISTDNNFSSSDDSDDEVILNRSGTVPSHWYESEEHRGYDVYGKRVVKTLTSSKIDELLKNAEDPDRWRTVQDLQNEREVYLTDADVAIIRRLRSGLYPDGSMKDGDYFVEYDDEPHKLHPMRNKDYPKSRFLASKDESKEIRRLVKLIRSGKLKPRCERLQRKPDPSTMAFDIWAPCEGDNETGRVRGPANLPAPKMPLPGNAESYHPPEEYLFTEEEKSEWLGGDESTRKTTFIPDNFLSLRRVPWYTAFITERFSRCLDLYSVPRMLKKKMNVDPESLLPKLPQISDLRPFPATLSVEYVGHESSVKGVSVSPLRGDWLASVSSDSIRVWDVNSGKCVWVEKNIADPTCIAWHPHLPILAVGDSEGEVHFIHISVLGDGEVEVDDIFDLSTAESEKGWRVKEERNILSFTYGASTPITSVAWHPKGNFLAICSAQSPSIDKSCCVVSLMTKKYVIPLKGKGQDLGGARNVIFHPSKPYLVVAGASNIGIFDLKNQQRVNLLHSNSQTICSVAVHPAGQGTHIIASSLDCKVIWFDTEVRDKPWKNFRHHTSAARKVVVHRRAADASLPLTASAGDDNAVHVLYSKVFVEDANKNPMVIPVKKLNHPDSVKDCQWHPNLPWIFTACDDGIVRLWA